jgi:hypothetical protein
MKRSELEIRRHHSRCTLCTVVAVQMSGEVQQDRWLWRLASVLHSVALCGNRHVWRNVRRLRRCQRWLDDEADGCWHMHGDAPVFTATIKVQPSVCRFARNALLQLRTEQSRKCGQFDARTAIRYDLYRSEIYETCSFSSTWNVHFVNRNSHNLSRKVRSMGEAVCAPQDSTSVRHRADMRRTGIWIDTMPNEVQVRQFG